MRLIKLSANRSRSVRLFSIEGNTEESDKIEKIGDLLSKEDDVNGVEFCKNESFYTLTVKSYQEDYFKNKYKELNKQLTEKR